MRARAHIQGVLIKGIKYNKFTVSGAKYPLACNGFWVVPSVALRRAVICWAHAAVQYYLKNSSIRNFTSRACLFSGPRTLQAFYEVCAKLGNPASAGNEAWGSHTKPSYPGSVASRTENSFHSNGIPNTPISFVQWSFTSKCSTINRANGK